MGFSSERTPEAVAEGCGPRNGPGGVTSDALDAASPAAASYHLKSEERSALPVFPSRLKTFRKAAGSPKTNKNKGGSDRSAVGASGIDVRL